MKKHLYCILAFLIQCSIACSAGTDADAHLLERLDSMIAHRQSYHEKVEANIARLQEKLIATHDIRSQFAIYGNLFQIYRSFKVDSALMIARKRLEMARRLGQPDSLNLSMMNLADAMNKLGRHDYAIQLLEKVQPAAHSSNYYYYLCHTTYLSCHENEVESSVKQKYLRKIKAYKDTLISISEPNSVAYITNYCGNLSQEGKVDEAIRLLEQYYHQHGQISEDKARMEYLLYELHHKAGHRAEARHFLILSPMTDISNAKRVYMSVQRLAAILFHEGDIARAYRYISCSLEDINAGNAIYRINDVTEVLPIIKSAYDNRIAAERGRNHTLLFLLTAAVITLVVAYLFIRAKNRKLLLARTSLAQQNEQLQAMSQQLISMNSQIKKSNDIKEKYIGLLFGLCSGYISRQEKLRQTLLKQVRTGTLTDISKTLNGMHGSSDEFKTFIRQFDTIFLSIYPDFVEQFNLLLLPEAQIIPKEDDLLTPELRIYALIRLGIDDNSKIAGFLHYSLQTVYNYRMKMRNKACSKNKDLAVQVMRIG